MTFDFLKDNYNTELDSDSNCYTALKCTEIGDTDDYPVKLRENYKKNQIDRYSKFQELFELDNDDLPKNSVLLEVDFELRRHFISNGDECFWPNKDNPIAKEKVLKVPLMRSSSWKGVLRDSARQLGTDENQIRVLFGNKKESENERKGRLNFFKTFFNDINASVIAPHDREKGVAKEKTSPIHFEVVPKGTKGTLKVMYYPFDLFDEENSDQKVKRDIETTTKVVKYALTEKGIGGKTANGHGISKILSHAFQLGSNNEELERGLRQEVKVILND